MGPTDVDKVGDVYASVAISYPCML